MSKPFIKSFSTNKPQPYIPIKKTDSKSIDKIFAIVQDGDYNKIKNFISESNITFKVENENGENLLHVILNNQRSDFDEEQKLELIKYFIDRGAYLDGPDKNNVTPLHLACKYQYPSIVKLLLEKGANANSKDNQFMKPIHYAVQGHLKECKKPKKVSALIPDDGIKIKSPINELRNATAIIVDILYSDIFKDFMSHIKLTLSELQSIFPDLFEDVTNSIIAELGILSGGNLGEKTIYEQKNLLAGKIEMVTSELYDRIKNKLEKSTSGMNISMNNVNGWGPTNKNIEKILQKKSITELITQYENEIGVTVVKNEKNLNSIIDELQKLKSQLSGKINNVILNLYDIIQINTFLKLNRDKTPRSNDQIHISDNDLNKMLSHDDTNKIIYQEINIKDFSNDDNLSPGDDASLKFFIESSDVPYKNRNTLIVRGTKQEQQEWKKGYNDWYLTEDKPIAQINYTVPAGNIQLNLNKNNVPVIFKGKNWNDYKENAINEISALYSDIDKITIQAAINSYTDFDYIKTPQEDLNWYNNLVNSNQGDYGQGNRLYWFVSKLLFAIQQINAHIDILYKNVKSVNDHFNKKYYYEIYHKLISHIRLSIFNIIQNMRMELDEKDYIIKKSNAIGDEYAKIMREKNHPYLFGVDAAMEKAYQATQIINDIYSDFNNIFGETKKLDNQLNNTIELLNSISGKTFTSKYFIDNNGEKKINDQQTEILQQLFNQPFQLLPRLPESLGDYYNKYSVYTNDTLEDLRRVIYEEYFPQISINHFPTYYNISGIGFNTDITANNPNVSGYITSNDLSQAVVNITTPQNNIPPQVGYLVENDVADVNINSVNPGGSGKITKVLPKLKYGSNGIDQNGNKTNTINNNNKLNPAIQTQAIVGVDSSKHIGSIGFDNSQNKRINRKAAAFTSVSNYLDNHLDILKFYIVQNVVSLFHNENFTGTSSIGAPIITDNDLKNNIKSLGNDIKKIVGDQYGINPDITADKKGAILYATVAKITDQLVQELIQNSIRTSIKKYINNIISKGYSNKEYSQLGGKIGQVVLNIDSGFKVNFNKLFDEIISLFFKPNANKIDYNRLKYAKKLMKDAEAVPDQYKIFDPNYLSTSKVIEQCYKIKPEIIDHLVTLGNTDINAKDYVQSSPIFYALEFLNSDLVKKLIDYGASVYTKSIANNVGVTPFSHIINLYEQHNNYVYDMTNFPQKILEKLYKPIYKKIKDNILSKKQYKNNIIKYMDIIFPQMLVMYNNYFYIHASNYINNWSYDKSQKLLNLLKDYGVINVTEMFNQSIPLLNGDNLNAVKNNSNLVALTEKDSELTKKIQFYDSEIADRQNRLDSITKEGLYYNNKQNKTQQEIKYMQQLNDKSININNQILDLQNEKNKLVNRKNGIDGNLNKMANEIDGNLQLRVTSFIGSEWHTNARTAARLYDNIFRRIINNKISKGNRLEGHQDYDLYNKLWERYINDNNKMQNITNIHVVSLIVQSKIIDRLKHNNSTDSMIKLSNDLKILKDLYNDIFSFIISSMDMLPQKIDRDNVFLKDVTDIITHCSKHIIFSNLYHAILRSIAEYVKSLNPKILQAYIDDPVNPYNLFKDSEDKDDIKKPNPTVLNIYGDDDKYTGYIGEIVDRFVQYDYDNKKNKGAKLKDYIVEELPLKTTKYVLELYAGDDEAEDEDMKITSIDEIFDEITTLLKKNPVLALTSESSLIKNLEEYVLPYYKDVAEQLIKGMKNIIDNYNRFIMNESKYIDVVSLVVDQSVKEM